MTVLPRGERFAPGCWWPCIEYLGKRTANLCCPVCGRGMTIMDHTIAVDGTVSPSVVCPYAKDGCSWHVFLRLLGWE